MKLMDACEGIPEGRGYRFHPASWDPGDPLNPRDPHYDGVSADLVHRGEVVARASGDGATYCCGVTFEAFYRAHGDELADWSADEIRALVKEWFCPTMGHPGVVDALVSRGLADRIEPSEARRGDLCQFWRSVDPARPSGHSVIFLAWSDEGRALRYWSSQPATGGVGVHEEPVTEEWRIYVARLRPLRSAAPGSTISVPSTRG